MSENKNFFRASAEDFKKIPGSPVAYWLTNGLFAAMSGGCLGELVEGRMGLTTGNNDIYLRLWFEIGFSGIGFNFDRKSAQESGLKWFPYNKAGEFRRWYGNLDYVVDWKDDGHVMQTTMHPDGKRIWAHNFNLEYNFLPHFSWSDITSGILSFRWYPKGCLFDASANAAFSEYSYQYLLGLTNASFVKELSVVLNPTIHFKLGDFYKLPFIETHKDHVENNVSLLLHVSKNDWDSYETSWDFTVNPLVAARNVSGASDKLEFQLSALYVAVREKWARDCEEMRRLETENNRIFIEAYGLQDELTPEVPWHEITLTCNPWYRYRKTKKRKDGDNEESSEDVDLTEVEKNLMVSAQFPLREDKEANLKTDTVKELISYAVGCMMGRYSLEKPGLVLADQGAGEADYYAKVGVSKDAAKFQIDDDGIIPILDNDWFADDIVTRFKEFVKVAFGEAHFFENMAWIEEALGKNLRDYFTKDFYKDHLQRYQNRPIYWLFQSPKGAFRALVYMHRYKPDMVGGVLGYLRSLQTKVENQLGVATQIASDESKSSSERVRANKEVVKYSKMQKELDEYEKHVLYPLSTERIEIDLDDGVKVNYAKFAKALAKVKALEK